MCLLRSHYYWRIQGTNKVFTWDKVQQVQKRKITSPLWCLEKQLVILLLPPPVIFTRPGLTPPGPSPFMEQGLQSCERRRAPRGPCHSQTAEHLKGIRLRRKGDRTEPRSWLLIRLLRLSVCCLHFLLEENFTKAWIPRVCSSPHLQPLQRHLHVVKCKSTCSVNTRVRTPSTRQNARCGWRRIPCPSPSHTLWVPPADTRTGRATWRVVRLNQMRQLSDGTAPGTCGARYCYNHPPSQGRSTSEGTDTAVRGVCSFQHICHLACYLVCKREAFVVCELLTLRNNHQPEQQRQQWDLKVIVYQGLARHLALFWVIYVLNYFASRQSYGAGIIISVSQSEGNGSKGLCHLLRGEAGLQHRSVLSRPCALTGEHATHKNEIIHILVHKARAAASRASVLILDFPCLNKPPTWPWAPKDGVPVTRQEMWAHHTEPGTITFHPHSHISHTVAWICSASAWAFSL